MTRRAGRAWWHPATWLPAVVALLAVAVLWQLVASALVDRGQTYLLPLPADVVGELTGSSGTYLSDAWTTLSTALLGVAAGGALAVLLAVVLSEVPLLARAVLPLAVVLNTTPVVALAPALVVAFGFGRTPKVIVTAVVVFFPVLVTVLSGLRTAPPDALAVLRSLRASRLEVLWRLRLPAALPSLFTALRVVLPLSVVGAVVAEFVAAGSSSGLGTLITTSAASYRLAPVYAAILVLAAMGVLLLGAVVAVERRVLRRFAPGRR